MVNVTPDEIKSLRKDLKCNTKELAATLGVTPRQVMDWEAEESFPTRRHVRQMQALREAGPNAVTRRKRTAARSPMEALADPELWRLVRKLLAHPNLRAEVTRLAEAYDDPADAEE